MKVIWSEVEVTLTEVKFYLVTVLLAKKKKKKGEKNCIFTVTFRINKLAQGYKYIP